MLLSRRVFVYILDGDGRFRNEPASTLGNKRLATIVELT